MKDQKIQDHASNSRIAHGVYIGKLLSPTEVAQATAERDSPVFQGLRRWTLCGDVSPAVFDLVQAMRLGSGAGERVTAFASPAGHSYVVFTHQFGTFQHRYLAPLFDSKVRECLQDITREGGLGYSLGGEGNEAIVWRSVLGPRDLLPLLAMCGSIPEGQEEPALKEYAGLLCEVREPARIPSVLEGITVRYASVSAITPHDLMSRLARRYGVSA